jgi:hypothetical protein
MRIMRAGGSRRHTLQVKLLIISNAFFKIKILDSESQTSGTYAKRAKQATKRRLLEFSELPSLPPAGSRWGCFHTSLGCKPRSLIRVSLGCSITQINVRKDNSTPAYSQVSDRRRLTALVEVHWALRVQAPRPQISGPNLQENHRIETCKEEGVFIVQRATAKLKTGLFRGYGLAEVP